MQVKLKITLSCRYIYFSSTLDNLLFLATVLYGVKFTIHKRGIFIPSWSHLVLSTISRTRSASKVCYLNFCKHRRLDSSHFADSSKSDLTPGPWILMELYQRIYMDTDKLLDKSLLSIFRVYLPWTDFELSW